MRSLCAPVSQERLLSATPAPDPVRIHPGMAWTYRARIGQLIAGLSEAGQMDEAREALRGLIETPELVPVAADEGDTGKPGLAIHLHGALASLLRLACGLPVQDVSGGVGQMQKAPRGAGRGDGICSQSGGADLQDIDTMGKSVLVAGATAVAYLSCNVVSNLRLKIITLNRRISINYPFQRLV
jgi:site-specific DNA recombinase